MDMNNTFDVEDKTTEFDTQDVQDAKVWSILAYFGILFFLPLVCAPQSGFGRFHANQGLILFLTSLILGIVNVVLQLMIGWIPFIGKIICALVSLVISLAALAWMIYGIVQAAQGKAKTLPLIGKFTLIR